MKAHIATFIVATAITLLVGCGKSELSRGNAEKAIESHISEKAGVLTDTIALGDGHLLSANETIDTQYHGEIKRQRESGYVTVAITGPRGRYPSFSGDVTPYKTSPSEGLRPFIVKSEPFGQGTVLAPFGTKLTLKIGEGGKNVKVTGMVKREQNRIAAEFTYETQFNDVGQKLFSKPAIEAGRGAALFTLYDDGWRLTQLQR